MTKAKTKTASTSGVPVFSIRPMKDTDALRVCALAKELGYTMDAPQFLGRLSQLSGNENHSVWVADSETAGVSGFLHLEKAVGLVYTPRLEVRALIVSEKERGWGLGTRMMKYAESYARTEDLQEVFLTMNVSRGETADFYEEMGYAKVKTSNAFSKRVS